MELVLLTFIALAQAGSPGDGPIYEIPIKGHDAPIYGWMEPKTGGWRITEDEPWNHYPSRTYPATQVLDQDRVLEVESKRDARRTREAERDGFKQVGEVWVSLQEAELAERANAMIAAVRRDDAAGPVAATTDSAPAAQATTEPVPSAGPGALTQWGFHAAIMIVAGILIALVVKFAILA